MTAIRIVDDHLELASIGVNTHAQIDTGLTKLAGIEVGATADQTKADIDGLGLSHGSLVDVGVDDHSQYVLADSTRDIVKDQNGITNLVVDNGTNGTAARAAFRVQTDSGSASFSALSAGHITSNQYKGDGALLESDASLSAGLHLSAVAGEIGFWQGNTRRGSIWTDGKWKIGSGVPTEMLDVGGNIAVSGTVDGVDVAALSIDVAGLRDNSIADTLHRHSELVASDGSPDPALIVDATGQVGIGTTPDKRFNIDTKITSGNDVDYMALDCTSIAGGDKRTIIFRTTNGANIIGKVGLIYNGARNDADFWVGDLWNSGAQTNQLFTVQGDGRVAIGTTTPATSAKLDITSTTGALLLPRMTTTQRNALTAVNGMLLYNSTLNKFQGYENGAWTSLI